MALAEKTGPASFPTAANVPLPYATPHTITVLVPKSCCIHVAALVEVRIVPSPAARNSPAANPTA